MSIEWLDLDKSEIFQPNEQSPLAGALLSSIGCWPAEADLRSPFGSMRSTLARREILPARHGRTFGYVFTEIVTVRVHGHRIVTGGCVRLRSLGKSVVFGALLLGIPAVASATVMSYTAPSGLDQLNERTAYAWELGGLSV